MVDFSLGVGIGLLGAACVQIVEQYFVIGLPIYATYSIQTEVIFGVIAIIFALFSIRGKSSPGLQHP